MAGYFGTKAVLLSTTAADVIGNAEIGGNLTVGGDFTSTGIDDNASSTAITIDSSQNVGIGTSSPSQKLQVNTASGNSYIRVERASQTTGQVGIQIGGGTSSTDWFTYMPASSNDLAFFGNSANRMTITSSGNVGIGTSSPAQALVVSESSTPTIQIKDGAASGTRVSGRLHIGEADTLGVSIENSTSAFNDNCAMVFKTSPPAGTITERMRIDSSGNLLIHRTSPATSEKSIAFTVDANGTVIDCGTTYSGFDQMRFWHNGNRVGTINVTASSTSYVTSSDYRLKTDAQPMTGASARVQALNPVNFEWIVDGTRVDGFLAHEAQGVVPEAVTGTKDAMRDEEYEVTPAVYEDVVIPAVLDEEGNELEAERTEQRLVTEAVMGTRSVPDYQGIDQSKLVPLLTAALQEALTEIADLKARVTALEAV